MKRSYSGKIARLWARLFGSRVGPVVDIHHVLDGELGVTLGSCEALVSEQFLNGAKVGSLFEHVGAESVAESVGMDVRGKALGDSDAFDDTSDAAGGEAASSLVDQQSSIGLLQRCQQLLTPG